jgi:branched-chain amino acid transport system permease protein
MKGIRKLPFVLLILVALFLPQIVTTPFYFHIVVITCIWSILASSLNLILGYTGQLSVAHGAFFGIGAYTSSLLVMKLGWNYWAAMPTGALLAAFLGLLIGIPALRTRGPYFAICSLGFGMIVQIIIDKWDTVTEGPRGLPSIPPPDPFSLPFIGDLSFKSPASQYYLILVCLVLTLFVIHRLIHSRVGRAWEAIKINEPLAESLGINAMGYKILSFTVSAFFAGIAGSLYAVYVTYIGPANASFMVGFEGIIFLVVGGSGTLFGPIVGSFIMTVVPEIIRALEEFRLLFDALIIIGFMTYMPHGLLGAVRSRWPQTRDYLK